MGMVPAAIAAEMTTGGPKALLPGLARAGRHAGAAAPARTKASAHIFASARTRPM
jgi:hypothetical protein